MRWSGEHWLLRDLGSRNGTQVDDRRLQPGETVHVTAGQTLLFGDAPPWVLGSSSAPGPEASAGAQYASGDEETLLLPNDEQALACVYSQPNGQWMMDAQGELRSVRDAERVVVDERSYVLHLPKQSPMIERTHTLGEHTLLLGTMHLHFAVSADEETVQMKANTASAEVTFKERAHHYTVLTLARLRQKDVTRLLGEQGWIERSTLGHMLRLKANALNLHLFRTRRQFTGAGIVGGSGIIEVRQGTHEVRLGVDATRLHVLGV
ncbi:MAG: hypothetical protein ACI9MC_000699 [Kiritimatiellia bacterium]|jgi:hypothetical protein